jgi:hypothetical protein
MQVTHSLKGDWFQPLNLSSEKLVSKFAFKCNLHRYNMGKTLTRSVRYDDDEKLLTLTPEEKVAGFAFALLWTPSNVSSRTAFDE